MGPMTMKLARNCITVAGTLALILAAFGRVRAVCQERVRDVEAGRQQLGGCELDVRVAGQC